MKWNLAEASEAGKVGQMTTLGSDLSVASATSHVGFNIGRINGRLLDLELSALEQNSRSISLPAHDCWPHTCSQPVSNRAVRSHTGLQRESGATSVEFKEAVLGMEVTPVVLPGGRVRLKLHISENMPGQVLQQADGETMAIDKQEIETQVEVKVEKRWRWAVFSRKRIKPEVIAYPGSVKSRLGSFFVMTVKTTNGVN